MIKSLLIFAFVSSAQMAPFMPEGFNGKNDFEMARMSMAYAKKHPQGTIDQVFTKIPAHFPEWRPYRHMHMMAAAAFYAKRRDQRDQAFQWLEKYECENQIACDDHLNFLDLAIKANVLKMNAKDKKMSAAIRERAEARLKSFGKRDRTGICGDRATPEFWLAREYELLCPPIDVEGYAGFRADSPLGAYMLDKLGLDSGQSVMSSSRLDTLEHDGPANCSGPWKTKLKCSGHKDLTRRFDCAPEAGTIPLKVTCKEIL